MTDNLYLGEEAEIVSHTFSGTYVPPYWWPIPGLLYQFFDKDGPKGRCLPYSEWDGAPALPTDAVFAASGGMQIVVDLLACAADPPWRAIPEPT
jgi:hypothetical protein